MSETAAPTPGTPARRMPRWLWVLLIASLALNLLIVGLMAGFAWRHGGWGGRGGPGHFLAGRLLRDLPEAKRSEIQALIEAKRTEIGDAWKNAGEAQAEAMRLFAAEPFDRTAFEAAVARLSEQELAARKSMLASMGEIGAKLSQEERQRVLRHFRKGWLGRRRGPGRGDGER